MLKVVESSVTVPSGRIRWHSKLVTGRGDLFAVDIVSQAWVYAAGTDPNEMIRPFGSRSLQTSASQERRITRRMSRNRSFYWCSREDWSSLFGSPSCSSSFPVRWINLTRRTGPIRSPALAQCSRLMELFANGLAT